MIAYTLVEAIPNLTVIRPADANETSQAWRVALEHHDGPVALILTRQGISAARVVSMPSWELFEKQDDA